MNWPEAISLIATAVCVTVFACWLLWLASR